MTVCVVPLSAAARGIFTLDPKGTMPQRRKQADPDVLRSKLNTGKGIGRYNATHRKGEPIASPDRSLRAQANRSPAPHGPPRSVPGSQVTHNEKLLAKPGEFGPKLIAAIKAKLSNVPGGVTPTKPVTSTRGSQPLPLPDRSRGSVGVQADPRFLKPRKRKPTQTAFPR